MVSLKRCSALYLVAGLLTLGLVGCSQVALYPPVVVDQTQGGGAGQSVPPVVQGSPATGGMLQMPRSRWVAAAWSDLPGWGQDALPEVWGAWLKSCERPMPGWQETCKQLRQLVQAPVREQQAWMQRALQPYRVESLQGESTGLLTSYYEPTLEASRSQTAQFTVPLYMPPSTLNQRRPWYTRQEMDTLPQVQEQLRSKVLVWVADPVDALVLQIQGSGRLRVQEPDGRVQWVRLSYAGSNDQPYRSVGRWLLDQNLIREGSWPSIKSWLAQNPQRTQELLWVNPRVTFFREDTLTDGDAGPRGAQGVALTPGRSIAVDPQSIPYGAPVWLASNGPAAGLQKMVIAQDTGSAITGAVRADYFAGWGVQSAELAGKLRQPLQMWIFWPKVGS